MAIVKLKDVEPVVFDVSLLETAKNRINRVGIELEGGWWKIPAGTRVEHDGSVRFEPNEVLQKNPGGRQVMYGEIVSPPIEVANKKGQLDFSMVDGWVKAYYPQMVNASCGLHIHMSFERALTYSQLMTPRYDATVLAYVKKWAVEDEKLENTHSLFARLNGTSRYCQHVFAADEQARQAGKSYDQNREGHRYTVINRCYTLHQTMECRLLPMMADAAQALRAIKYIVQLTNAFLVTTTKKERKLKSSSVVDTREVYSKLNSLIV